ncbi:MAG: FixH family protein [Chitinophagaceae bacterium]|nr:FixH family protein [Chitinophagaceae bacterium]HMN33325.1 FixH family protein [Chitinophagaceae bacterium]
MNWGYKILTVVILFLVGMLSMVYVAFKQTNEMIDENYYEKELVYQQIIQAKENLHKYSTECVIQKENENLVIKLPIEIGAELQSGTINFIKMSESDEDKKVHLNTNAEGSQIIDCSSFAKGEYLYRINWSHSNQDFFQEGYINI